MKVDLHLSTFGLWDVLVNGEIKEKEIPLIMAQAAAYCYEHGIDRGWTVENEVVSKT